MIISFNSRDLDDEHLLEKTKGWIPHKTPSFDEKFTELFPEEKPSSLKV